MRRRRNKSARHSLRASAKSNSLKTERCRPGPSSPVEPLENNKQACGRTNGRTGKRSRAGQSLFARSLARSFRLA